jgi:hypothetical protein
MLRFNFMFNANSSRKVLGKFSYLIFKDNFHGYNSIYWFNDNIT